MTRRAAVPYLAGLAGRTALTQQALTQQAQTQQAQTQLAGPPPVSAAAPARAQESLRPPRPLFAGPAYRLEDPQDPALQTGSSQTPAVHAVEAARADVLAPVPVGRLAQGRPVPAPQTSPAPEGKRALRDTYGPASPEATSAGAAGMGGAWPTSHEGAGPGTSPATPLPAVRPPGPGQAPGQAAGTAPSLPRWWGEPVELPGRGAAGQVPAEVGELARDLMPRDAGGHDTGGHDTGRSGTSRRAPAGRVTIGTIEVTVVPPAQHPAHSLPAQTGPAQTVPAPAASPVPAEAGSVRLRDGLRRWYGIAQG
jgi:hypothetical protein